MSTYDDLIAADTLGSAELDAEILQAGHVLGELAKEAGVDLNELSDDDVADLLVQLRGEEQTKVAGLRSAGEHSNMTDPNALTHADVAAELAKVASDNGVNMAEVSREEYHAAYDALAERMTTQDYYLEKQAQEEAYEKLAEADLIGRQMAVSFRDELEKGASALEKLKNLGGAVAEKAGRGATEVAGRVGKGGFRGAGRIVDPAEARQLGKKVLGGAAAGTAALTGAGVYAATRDKKSAEEQFEQDALDLAQSFLDDAKVASHEDYADAVTARAAQILAENGYSI